jgi:hypothetical protein
MFSIVHTDNLIQSHPAAKSLHFHLEYHGTVSSLNFRVLSVMLALFSCAGHTNLPSLISHFTLVLDGLLMVIISVGRAADPSVGVPQ